MANNFNVLYQNSHHVTFPRTYTLNRHISGRSKVLYKWTYQLSTFLHSPVSQLRKYHDQQLPWFLNYSLLLQYHCTSTTTQSFLVVHFLHRVKYNIQQQFILISRQSLRTWGAFWCHVKICFSRKKVFYSPLDGMLVHRRITTSSKFFRYHLYTWVKRATVKVPCWRKQRSASGRAVPSKSTFNFDLWIFSFK